MTTPFFASLSRPRRFALAAMLLSGASFFAGRFVTPHRTAPPEPASPTQIAQAGSRTVRTPGGRSAAAKPISSDKRVRSAAHTFAQVEELVQSEYVDPLPSDTLLAQNAARAMLSALEDSASRFLTPAERRVIEAENAGRFAGIGCVTAIRVTKTKAGFWESHLAVVAPLPGSPARIADLRTGDRITHIDGNFVLRDTPYLTPSKLAAGDGKKNAGIGLLAAQMMLRQGVSGSHTLTVSRPGTTSPLRVTVTNTATPAPPPTTRPGADGTVCIHVPAFTPAALAMLRTTVAASPSRGIVLDVRQNPGVGSFDVARSMVALLAGNRAEKSFAVEVGTGGRKTSLPMPAPAISSPARRVAVLTDGGTAGLAEAVTAYLADSCGAKVIGEKHTWGDGGSETMYPLADGSAFTLTTGSLRSPKGTAWNGRGLTPTVLLPSGLSDAEAIARASATLRVPQVVAKEEAR